MADLTTIRREHVIRAVRELAGPDGDGGAVASAEAAYRLERAGHEYDVIEVVDRALWLATGDDMADEVDPPDARDCALLLRGLGFEVLGEGLPPLRWTSAATVGAEHSRATWALAARERLLEVAATYGDSVDYHELADFVQRRSLVRTTAHPRSWIGDVLGRVADDCTERREPLLTALVVDAQGRVGASYATALLATRGEEPADVDAQAAEERLACHRHFGAELPADGGAPVVLHATAPRRPAAAGTTAGTSGGTTTGGSRAVRERAPRKPAAPRRTKVGARRTAEENVAASATAQSICPVHFTVLSPSGACDFCD